MTEPADSDDNIEELARWFLLSVCQHLEAGDWLSAADCSLPGPVLDNLVASYLADRSARQSLIMVLKDSRYRYQLVRFGRNRDHQQRQLSDSTIAFRRARALLMPVLGQSTESLQQGVLNPAPATASARRAARRAQPVANGDRTRNSDPREVHDAGMSDEEYAHLERAMTAAPADSESAPRRYRSNEDRMSLLYGLLSGALLFILVYWFILA